MPPKDFDQEKVVENIVTKTGIHPKVVLRVLRGLVEVITDALNTGDRKFPWTGVGTLTAEMFLKRPTPEPIFNPHQGKMRSLSKLYGRTYLRFSPSAVLLKAIRQNDLTKKDPSA